MGPFTKIRIYGETFLANKANVPLHELLDVKARSLVTKAPAGQQPFYLTVQPDGSTVTSEIVRPDEDKTDELALRDNMGDIYSNNLQRQATLTMENIARLNMVERDARESLHDIDDRLNDLMEHTPDYHFAKEETRRNLVWLVILSAGEIGAMFSFFLDFFGLDSLKLSKYLIKQPWQVMSALAFTVAFYITSLLVAEHALKGNRRPIWYAALALLSCLTAYFRAAQTTALGENDSSPLLLACLYAAIGFAFPLAAAVFYVRWQDAAHLVGMTDSAISRLREQETMINEKLKRVDEERERANEHIEKITEEYVAHYQESVTHRNNANSDWESHRRRVEAYLADTRLAYDFWTGWRQRTASIPKPARRLIQIAGALLVSLAVLFAMSHVALADTAANFIIICDDSSSAAGYSCNPETLSALGLMWSEKADEAGQGSFQLFLIDRDFDSTSMLFSITYPDHFPGPVTAHKKKWRNDFIRSLGEKTRDMPHDKGSAIVEGIYRSSLRMPKNGETVIFILSDMREVSGDGAFNFERRVPTEKEFTRWLHNRAIIPDFGSSTRIQVCGCHPYTPGGTSKMTSRNYNQLISLWQAVFKEWRVEASISEACDFNN